MPMCVDAKSGIAEQSTSLQSRGGVNFAELGRLLSVYSTTTRDWETKKQSLLRTSVKGTSVRLDEQAQGRVRPQSLSSDSSVILIA